MSNQTTYGVVQLIINNGRLVGTNVLDTGLTRKEAAEHAAFCRYTESDKKTYRYKIFRDDKGYMSVAYKF